MKKFLGLTLMTTGKLLAATITWEGDVTAEMSTAANWNPATVPGIGDTALFDSTGDTFLPVYAGALDPSIDTDTLFFPDPVSYTITLSNSRVLSLFGTGIVNTSGVNQTVQSTASSSFLFNNAATADNLQIVVNTSAEVGFLDSSTAANSTMNVSGTGRFYFADSATAGNATIITSGSGSNEFLQTSNAGSATINLTAGGMSFQDDSSAASSTITAAGSTLQFLDNATAGDATMSLSGNSILTFVATTDAGTAEITADNILIFSFSGTSSAANAVINALNGTTVAFAGASTGASAQVNLTAGADLTTNHSITLGSLSSDATGLVSLGGNNLEVGNLNTSTVFAGVATGVGGSLTKVGTGTFTMSGANIYTGPTTVSGGTLSLLGTVAGDFIVEAGATAHGPGGLVGGSYTQNDDSFFLVTTAAPILNVTGPVTILGGQVAVAPGSYPLLTRFPILTSAVSRTGVYDGAFEIVETAFDPILDYDDFSVYLTFVPAFRRPAMTPNQIETAGPLELTTDPALLNALFGLTIPQFLNALDQLSGEQYASLVGLNENTSRNFLRSIYDNFRPECGYLNQPRGGATVGWISGSLGQAFIRKDYNAQGLEEDHYGFNVGVHQYFFSNVALGIAGNYEYDRARFNLGGRGHANTVQGALYGVVENPLGYLFAEAGGGHTRWDVTRTITFPGFFATATSNPTINHFAAYGELGVNFGNNLFLLQPFFGLDYGHHWLGSTQESGAGAASLFFDQQNYDDFETRLGLHLNSHVNCRFYVSVDAAWRHRVTELNNNIDLNFVEFGPAFTILAPEWGRDSFEGALYLGMPVSPSLTVYVEGSGEVRQRFGSYAATVGVRKIW